MKLELQSRLCVPKLELGNEANWFKRMESHGTKIHWLDGAGDPLAEALAEALELIAIIEQDGPATA